MYPQFDRDEDAQRYFAERALELQAHLDNGQISQNEFEHRMRRDEAMQQMIAALDGIRAINSELAKHDSGIDALSAGKRDKEQ